MAAPPEYLPADSLSVKGLPAESTEESVRAMFANVGPVVSVKLLPAPPGADGAGGSAHVRMASAQDAQWLVDNVGQVSSAAGATLVIKFSGSGGFGSGGKGGGKGAHYGVAAPPPPVAPPAPSLYPASTRLYVKGLPLGMTEEQVKSVFSGYGNCISCKVLHPPPNGAPDTAAIVQMGSTSEAQWLVDNVNGNIPQGLPGPVEVKFKTERENAPRADAPGWQGAAPGSVVPAPQPVAPAAAPPPPPGTATAAAAGAPAPSESIFVKGLPSGLTEEGVALILSSYGTVASCTIVQSPDPMNGTTDTACNICMSTLAEASFLVENLNGNIPHGLAVPVSVCYADVESPKAAGKGAAASPPPPPAAAASPPGEPSDNLYVKGFPEGTTEEMIHAIFSGYGKVVSTKVLVAPPGVTDVACLVRMATVAEAQWLVTNLNGNIPQGMNVPIQVVFNKSSARSGESKALALTAARAAAPPASLGAQPCKHNLYVKGFPPDINEPTLKGILGQYGTVRACIILPPPRGHVAAASLVRMGAPQEAQWLVDRLNGNIPTGMATPIEVRYASTLQNAKGGGKGPYGYSPY